MKRREIGEISILMMNTNEQLKRADEQQTKLEKLKTFARKISRDSIKNFNLFNNMAISCQKVTVDALRQHMNVKKPD